LPKIPSQRLQHDPENWMPVFAKESCSIGQVAIRRPLRQQAGFQLRQREGGSFAPEDRGAKP